MKSKNVEAKPSERPWRIERITRQREAVIKGADNSIVAVCHADNAELIVEAVNNYKGLTSPNCGAWPKKPKPHRIELPPDLQAARDDSVEG